VSGRLPPEVIQRIVRQSVGRFRACYEKGALKKNLEGEVRVRFVIGRDGALGTVDVEASTLEDAETVGCVKRVFLNMSFPQPEGGIVTVSYPIRFSADDGPRPP
jgi:TonB family protein